MNEPKTHLRDFRAFQDELNNLRRLNAQKSISEKEFYLRVAGLKQQYEDRLFPEDVHLFDNIEGLTEFLESYNLPTHHAYHELAHATTARELGYDIKFGCQLLITECNEIRYKPFIRVLEDMTTEDFRKIVSAPKDLSSLDQDALDAIK